jgi:two-component system, OmpR family, sensor histidine kinase KdpD
MSDQAGTARRAGRGRLKVFLGYAAGVGKTFRMLEEAQVLRAEGRDVVVGYFEPHGRHDTIARVEGLEVVPRRRIDYRGHEFEEMDPEAILARHPAICAVDEFPHTNVPGSQRPKRWEDVVALLDAGIDVLTTMNVQHLESLNDQLQDITGVRVRETIPDWVVKEAEEVVLIDLPPRALLNRLQRGVVYPPDKVARAMESFFKEPTLAALREMAMRLTAHEVDQRHSGVEPGPVSSVEAQPASRRGSEAIEGRERILIHVTDSPATAALIRRGRRVADYLKGDCFAVCVVKGTPKAAAQDVPGPRVAEHLDFARRLHIETRALVDGDEAHALVAFARANAVTQIFLPRPARRPLALFSRRHTTMRVVRLAHDMQVTIVAERKKNGP